MIKIIIIFFIILLSGCKAADSTKNGSSKSYDELINSRQVINIGGKTLNANIFIWRDLMPVIDESKKGILISVKLTASDGGSLPANLRPGKLWVFDINKIWETVPSLTDASNDKELELYARNGLSWEPESKVHVAFDLIYGNETTTFLVKEQVVNAVY